MLSVIHDIGRLELLLDEPHETVKNALRDIISEPIIIESARFARWPDAGDSGHC